MNQVTLELEPDHLKILIEELRQARKDARRQTFRLRLAILMLCLFVALTGWTNLQSVSHAQSQPTQMNREITITAEERMAQRRELMAKLSEDQRTELEKFAQQAEWLQQYLQTWQPEQASSLVALMLFRMAKNMNTLPSMEEQMRVMSGQMSSLPAIVAELNQINLKMSLIAANMDSTMGRAGRMMPWMPFAP